MAAARPIAGRRGGAGDASDSWDELEASLGEPDLERLEIVRRGRSGRVVTLAVIDRSGNRRLIEGFDVRRALDLPETLFEMHDPDPPGWRDEWLSSSVVDGGTESVCARTGPTVWRGPG